MQESGPKIVSPREILKALQKKSPLYLGAYTKYDKNFQEGITNTAKALNAIISYFRVHSEEEDESKQVPASWSDISIPNNITFLFVKDVDGTLTRGTPNFEIKTPAILLTAMKKFHGLSDLMTKQEAIDSGKLEVKAEPIDFEKRSQEIGVLWRQRAGILKTPSPEKTPEAPTILAIEDQVTPKEPKVVPKRPSSLRSKD